MTDEPEFLNDLPKNNEEGKYKFSLNHLQIHGTKKQYQAQTERLH